MLRGVAERVWVAEQPVRTMGQDMGIRMTVVRLRDGGLWLHSPVRIDEPLRKELEALGRVRVVVAPNRFHHLHLSSAKHAFPQARFLAAPGLEKKRTAFAFDGALGADPDPLAAGDLEQIPIAGMPLLSEVVFFHLASRTLVVCDLLFNLKPAQSGWGRLLQRLNGAGKGPAQSRLLRLVTKDRAAARSSIDQVLAWDFDRIVLAHGDIVPNGGRDVLRLASAWLNP